MTFLLMRFLSQKPREEEIPAIRARTAIRHKKKASLCISQEAVGIALTEIRREETHCVPLQCIVGFETSYISCDDHFAVAN